MSLDSNTSVSKKSVVLALAVIPGVVWALVAFGLFYSRNPFHYKLAWLFFGGRPLWVDLLQEPWLGVPWAVMGNGSVVAWVAVVVTFLGSRMFRRFIPDATMLDTLVWGGAGALGFGGMGLFFLGIVGLPLYSTGVFWAILLVFTFIAIVMNGCKVPNIRSLLSVIRSFGKVETVVILLVSLLHLIALLYALTPSIQSDALRYHLAAPQEWLKAGRLAYLPYNAFSCFPSLIEMWFLFAMGLAGDMAAKGMHFLFLPLTSGAVALLTREVLLAAGVDAKQEAKPLGLRPELLAAVVWSTLPVVVFLAGWAFIDLGIVLFTLAVVLFSLRWARQGRARDLVLAGLFGGFLVASKYTGVLTIIWGACLVAILGMVSDPGMSFGAALKKAVWFGLLAAAFGAPWWLKNVIYTGNPVYPLAFSVFGGGGEWTKVCADTYAEKLGVAGMGRSLSAFLMMPWNTAMYSKQFRGFETGPFFLLFAPVVVAWGLWAISRLRQSRAGAMLALWAVFFLFSWFFTYQSNRFLLPLLGVGVCIVVAVVTHVWQTFRRAIFRFVFALVFALPVLYSGVNCAFWLLCDGGKIHQDNVSSLRWPAYTLGFLSRDAYLAANLNYYPLARYANELLGEDAKILLVGEHRRMHWKGQVEGNDWYDSPIIKTFIDGAPDANAVLNTLQSKGFTHMAFNLDEWGWPLDRAAQLGDIPPIPGTAWSFNIRHFSHGELQILADMIGSERLSLEYTPAPELSKRLFIARIHTAPHVLSKK